MTVLVYKVSKAYLVMTVHKAYRVQAFKDQEVQAMPVYKVSKAHKV